MNGRSGRSGFTLIEVLIAISITAIIATLVWGSFSRTFDSREFVLETQQRYHTVRLALQRMVREISSAFVYDCRQLETPTGEIRYRTLFKVEQEGKSSRITFTSFSHMRMFRDVHESDQNVLSYYVEPDPATPSQLNLMRREKARIDGQPEEGGTTAVLCPDVQWVQVQLWDRQKKEWVDEWDCSQVERLNRLPELVKVELSFVDERGEDMTLSTITPIYVSKPLANFIKPSQ
ncbi:MAG: prepilin-type N-terminal cleavage/methylation domain-containing protein [Deltaproteobacteria bacterium]|nr:MAG: prepilin-type N-terminal cleavage/methylation domain-containing protein [Deltaproteobacteria bacterium]